MPRSREAEERDAVTREAWGGAACRTHDAGNSRKGQAGPGPRTCKGDRAHERPDRLRVTAAALRYRTSVTNKRPQLGSPLRQRCASAVRVATPLARRRRGRLKLRLRL